MIKTKYGFASNSYMAQIMAETIEHERKQLRADRAARAAGATFGVFTITGSQSTSWHNPS